MTRFCAIQSSKTSSTNNSFKEVASTKCNSSTDKKQILLVHDICLPGRSNTSSLENDLELQ